MQSLINKIVLCVMFLIGAFAIVVVLRNLNQIDFDFKLPVTDLISIGVTVFLAWWVADKIEKGLSEERYEKELLNKKLSELDGYLKDFKNWIDTGDSFLSTVMESRLKEYRRIASQVNKVLENRYNNISKNYQGRNSLPGRITMLKQLCTLVPLRNDSNEITLEEEEYTYDSIRVSMIDRLIDLIREEIFQVQLRINRG